MNSEAWLFIPKSLVNLLESHLGSPYIAPKKEILQELFFSYFTNEKAKA